MNYFKSIPILLLFLLAACQSCETKKNSDSLLDHEYDVVMGILSPDSANDFIRTYSTEVFVGKMVPADINNTFFIEGISDPALYDLMYCARQYYINYYEYDSTATVSIEGNNQIVQLTYVGKGIYKDIDLKLKIRALEAYTLNVTKNDTRIFTASTAIPGNLKITSIGADTIAKTPVDRGDTTIIEVASSEDQLYYALIDSRSNFETMKIYSFRDGLTPWILFTKSGTDTTHINYVNVKFEMRSVNHNYGLFHTPCGYGAPGDFFEYQKTLEEKNIKERSNIQGSNVVGVFGAYNGTVKNVVYKALWGN